MMTGNRAKVFQRLTLNNQDQTIRDALVRYRGDNIMGLVRGLGFLVAGLFGLALSLTGVLFNQTNSALPGGWLYDHLGEQGTQLAAVGICAICTLLGLYWTVTRYRNLTTGVKAYEDKLRAERENRA